MDDVANINIFIEDEYIGRVFVELKLEYVNEIGNATELGTKIKECLSQIIRENSVKNTFQ